jgi:hypothetical protein
LLRLGKRLRQRVDFLRRLRRLGDPFDLLRDLVEDGAGFVFGGDYSFCLYDLSDCRLPSLPAAACRADTKFDGSFRE